MDRPGYLVCNSRPYLANAAMRPSNNNKATVVSRLCPPLRCAICRRCIPRPSQTVAPAGEYVGHLRRPRKYCQCHRPLGPLGLRGNVTSSTKPEVHNVLRYRQKRTDQRLRITRTENFLYLFRLALGLGKVCCFVCFYGRPVE